MNNSDTDIKTEQNINFGSALAVARKTKNYSIEDVSEYLKIPVQTIKAIEESSVDTLPPPTFTQGYIRAYAKYLEISEQSVLDMYDRAVPHDSVTELKPRSNLPGETNSQSPLVRLVTILLLIAGIAAVVFGSYQYYQKKAGVMESELESKERSFTGNSLDSPGTQQLNIQQKARLTDDDELIVEQSDPIEDMSDKDQPEIETEAAEAFTEPETVPETVPEVKSVVIEDEKPAEKDTLEIIAHKGSWMEVIDASQARLLYNMVPEGGHKVLIGQAPFRISLGNAKSTRIVINDLEVDMSKYIRPNNTAKFTVSVEDQEVVFY